MVEGEQTRSWGLGVSFPNVGTLGGNFIRRFRLFVKEAGFLWLTALLRPGFECYLISPMFRRVEEAEFFFHTAGSHCYH